MDNDIKYLKINVLYHTTVHFFRAEKRDFFMFLSLITTSRGIDRVINELYVSNFVSVLSSKMYRNMVLYSN
jgi:hypothetical protein